MASSHKESAALLSRQHQNDADSTHSASHDGFDSDEETFVNGKSSEEIARHDNTLLEEEEEREKLLTAGSSPGGFRRFAGRDADNDGTFKIGRREKSRLKGEVRQERRRRKQRAGEESELMYELEEGHKASSASSRSSSESDQLRLGMHHAQQGTRRNLCRRISIYSSIAILFIILMYAAYRATKSTRSQQSLSLLTLSNGTSSFAPTTVLISLDGFRADFLQRGLTPTLNKFIEDGISPRYMLPSFPSVTFPNHYTMATGLYPESHGVVGNTFWDPHLQDEFYYTHPEAMNPKWWHGEPIWVTAESQGFRSAIHMWPGSESDISDFKPAYVDKYNGKEKLSKKVDRVLELLDTPGPDEPSAMADQPRPQLIAAYVPVVDQDGHKYGPNSTEIRQTINDVDVMLDSLFNGLQERNLTDIVNVVVVSDHGMATTDVTRMIQLEDLVDTSAIEHIDGWPLYGLRPKNIGDLMPLYQQLKQKAAGNPNFEVYLKSKDMPERYHFSNNDRIAPLWIVPKAGWAIVTKDEFDVEAGLRNGEVYHPRGLHGYDHEHPLMRAIFVARGPAFPHKPGSRVEVFQNTEVYNIVCDSIGLTPKPNNGTLRLPLKPVGLHADEGAPKLETPPDPPTAPNPPTKPDLPSAADLPQAAAPSIATDPAAAVNAAPGPVIASTLPEVAEALPGPEGGKDGPKEGQSWWDWFTGRVEAAKEWAKGVFNGKGKENSG